MPLSLFGVGECWSGESDLTVVIALLSSLSVIMMVMIRLFTREDKHSSKEHVQSVTDGEEIERREKQILQGVTSFVWVP